MNIEDSDGWELYGELKTRPMLLKDIVKMDAYISRAFQICRKLSPEDEACIEFVASLACDHLSELCDEIGFCSAEADFERYVCSVFRFEQP